MTRKIFWGAVWLFFCSFSCFQKSDHFLVICTDARKLDYTSVEKFCKTVALHPSDGSKNGDIGHAWIYLHGKRQAKCLFIEGGHSQKEIASAGYLEAFFFSLDKQESNCASILFKERNDGFFEWGTGGHTPTYAAGFSLTEEQFEHLLSVIETYPYKNYSLIKKNCCTFVIALAREVGIDISGETILSIPKSCSWMGKRVELWQDPVYAFLPLATPESIESALKALVIEKKGCNALFWYQKMRKRGLPQLIFHWVDTVTKLPSRLLRNYLLSHILDDSSKD